MSLETDKTVECPLCMESLDFDDVGFFPCTCGYQICRFCWHRIRNDDNGLCPACRQEYPENPANFTTMSIETFEAMKKQKRKQKQNRNNGQSHVKMENLQSIRVVQKNLLFVIGLSSRLTHDDLRREFGKYGKIVKLVLNASTAYVTYARADDAIMAITALNVGNGKRASLGTTKYCTHWLRMHVCPKIGECMYLHEMADPEASFTKEEMQMQKHIEYEQRLITNFITRKEQQQQRNQKTPEVHSTEVASSEDESDADLDFDPIRISASGLEDLIRNEQRNQQNSLRQLLPNVNIKFQSEFL